MDSVLRQADSFINNMPLAKIFMLDDPLNSPDPERGRHRCNSSDDLGGDTIDSSNASPPRQPLPIIVSQQPSLLGAGREKQQTLKFLPVLGHGYGSNSCKWFKRRSHGR
uniref:Uncharacterized protein n=1 Tax=Oryza punctata TaxID=4537 RepID=A0A0E0L0B3_ORYPU